MKSCGEFERERSELDSLLKSGIFNRAPNLALVLNYVCSKYFDHKAGEIKEYNIAVEALDRSPEFDPRADAIVRVEAHRLRKRLKDYYRAEGADRTIQIEIPRGQYAPRFLILGDAPAVSIVSEDIAPVPVAADTLPAIPVPTPAIPAAPAIPTAPAIPAAPAIPTAPAIPAAPAIRTEGPGLLQRRWLVLAAVLLLCTALPMVRLHGGRTAPLASSLDRLAIKPSETIRIACGLESGDYVDQSNNTWSSDTFFNGGTAIHENLRSIRGTRDPGLYIRRREGAFRYDIPLKPGVYELRLHFAETVYGPDSAGGGGESSRVFAVAINGHTALSQFDIVADREAAAADIRVFKDVSPSPDGQLHLQFTPVSNMPIVSGIEISPGVPGRMRPIRMVARDRGYTDKQGRYWEPDRYAIGGQLNVRNEVVAGATDPDLYRSERFGNLAYIVPVAEGRYRVRLYFAETWFGPGNGGRGPGIGSRIFDILCNGVAVRRDFDIYKEARGSDRALTLEIPGVTPNHQGKIVISMPPSQNYACINAIEILDESR